MPAGARAWPVSPAHTGRTRHNEHVPALRHAPNQSLQLLPSLTSRALLSLPQNRKVPSPAMDSLKSWLRDRAAAPRIPTMSSRTRTPAACSSRHLPSVFCDSRSGRGHVRDDSSMGGWHCRRGIEFLSAAVARPRRCRGGEEPPSSPRARRVTPPRPASCPFSP